MVKGELVGTGEENPRGIGYDNHGGITGDTVRLSPGAAQQVL